MEFLWLFLPVVFLVSRLLPKKAVNGWLLVSSLFFYAFGEPVYIVLMLISIIFNYGAGFCINFFKGKWRVVSLTAAAIVNILLLVYFKYYDFLVTLINSFTGRGMLRLKDIALPIGISFFTFQIMSYLFELYRGKVKLQKSLFKLALYISFFPQLIAGPIVNYADIENQISTRKFSPEQTAYGIKRFIWGLSKKVLIANILAATVDGILAIEINEIPSGYLWLAYLLYAMQIYYDFSGYSDMAIGLGRMFGFNFLENFDYPYLSATMAEFWRRWHISLSSWFRSNLYIPLGGNRKGNLRTAANLLIVFALTGLWHGAGLNFLVWGLWHGIFIVAERFSYKKERENGILVYLRRAGTLVVVYFGWIFFRAGSITTAVMTIIKMFSFSSGNPDFYFRTVGSGLTLLAAAVAAAGCGPAQIMIPKLKAALLNETGIGYIQIGLLSLLLAVSIVFITIGSYNPFIYFRF